MPPAIRWHPAFPFAILMIASFKDFAPSGIELDAGGGAEYTETGFLLPALLDGQIRGFIPWIFPSNIAAMFAGREIYGYPKTYANTIFDERFSRFILRRRGDNAMTVRFAHRTWGEVRPGEVIDLFRNMGAVMSLPWRRVEGKPGFDNPVIPPPVNKPFPIPLFGALGPYMEMVSGLLPLLPGVLRTLPVACWKRNFSSAIRYPGELIALWMADDFDLDQIAGSAFVVDGLSRCTPIRLDHPEGIRMRYAGETDLDPGDQGHEQILRPLGPLGLWLEYDMTMTTGSQLVDFKRRGAEGQARRLEYGPRARSED